MYGQNTQATDEFKHSTIKTPFEKMRARAIINAGLDTKGLSLINFNLTHFLSFSKRNDGLFILSLWACTPIQKAPEKFQQHSQQGIEALEKRIDILLNNLKSRGDLPNGFLKNAETQMKNAVSQKMNELTQSVA